MIELVRPPAQHRLQLPQQLRRLPRVQEIPAHRRQAPQPTLHLRAGGSDQPRVRLRPRPGAGPGSERGPIPGPPPPQAARAVHAGSRAERGRARRTAPPCGREDWRGARREEGRRAGYCGAAAEWRGCGDGERRPPKPLHGTPEPPGNPRAPPQSPREVQSPPWSPRDPPREPLSPLHGAPEQPREPPKSIPPQSPRHPHTHLHTPPLRAGVQGGPPVGGHPWGRGCPRGRGCSRSAAAAGTPAPPRTAPTGGGRRFGLGRSPHPQGVPRPMGGVPAP